ncbi:MAG: 6-hydroxymethylpterin diphosphokinase MptE-like protein [bacterium]
MMGEEAKRLEELLAEPDDDAGVANGEQLTQTHDERNMGVLRSWFPRWVRNATQNWPTLEWEFGRRDLSLLNLAHIDHERERIERHWRGPAIVVGSGPSLNDAAPLLKDWKGMVFCTGSNAKTLMRYGREPDVIGMFDCGDAVYDQIRGARYRKAKLVTNPSVSPKVMRWWRWPHASRWNKRYYIMNHFGHDWFEDTLPVLFPYIRCSVMNAGSTGNNLVQIAWFIGCSPIFLVGFDLGFNEKVYRADMFERPWTARVQREGWKRHKVDVQLKREGTLLDPWVRVCAPPPPPTRKIYRTAKGLLTTEEQIEYKMALFDIWRIDRMPMINCSPRSLIDPEEMPYVPIEEVIKSGGKGFEHLYKRGEEIDRIGEAVHARHSRASDEGDVDRQGKGVRPESGGGVRPDQGGGGAADGAGRVKRFADADSRASDEVRRAGV